MQQSCGDAGGEGEANGTLFMWGKQIKNHSCVSGALSCTPTLSKREIFIAFIVAESTSIGGPSSNTSLMNSFAWLDEETKPKKVCN